MSTKNTILTVGLTALGLFGYAATRAAYSGDPVPPSGHVAAPASPATPSVLLLTNGRLLQGTVVKDGEKYIISQNGGEIPFHKSQVEDVFSSVIDVYKYKLSQIPVNDPDEHMKLARWCLGQNLTAEARAELKVVLGVSPGSNDAKLMLASIDASEVRAAARPRVDPGLVQTRAEMPQPGSEHRPAEIDANVLRMAAKQFGGVGLPVIFDLPQAIAVRRAQTFTMIVHGVLLESCAKCHNEKYEGNFQLIQVKRKRDMTADVIRANLDATLKLINSENPAQSVLLSSTLLPHGKGLNPKPIFRGSNDPRFQIISKWVNSLRTTKPSTDGVVQTRFGPARESANGGAGFASDRSGASDAAQSDGMPKPYVDFKQTKHYISPTDVPPARFVEGQGMVTEDSAPSQGEFPVTNMLGGQQPKLKPPAGVSGPLPKGALGKPDPSPVPMPGDALPDLPAVPGQSPPAASKDKAKAVTPKKPVKLDPSVLEKLLQNRNLSR